jgi:hypothetical protein
MPKSVSPPTPARKRAETASKRTVRNLRKSEEQRRKAIALLNNWSDAHVAVELIAGSSGLRIMGYLVKLQMNPAGDDFMFKTPFGVAATVFTMIYDEVEVDELQPDAPAVLLSMSKFPEVRFRLEARLSYAASTQLVKTAEDLFDAWIEENARLLVTIGDDLRVSACICEMTKTGESVYMLADTQAKTVHMVFPGQSGIIEIDHRDSGAEVTLHNRRTNSHIAIRKAPNGATESPEELLARYPLASRSVH